MTSITQPSVIIYDTSADPIVQYDLSKITTKVAIYFGKNQPFAKAVVTISKNYFADLNYWTSQGFTAAPVITDSVTPITVTAYGEVEKMVVTKHEGDSSSITLTCYAAAYKLKTTKLTSFSTFTCVLANNIYTFTSTIGLPIVSQQARAYSKSDSTAGSYVHRFVLSTAIGTYTVRFQVAVTVTVDASLAKSITDVTTEYLFGTPQALFAFIAVYGAGYETNNLIIDAGYQHDVSVIGLKAEYTEAEMATLKTSRIALTEPYKTVKLRPDSYCWAQMLAVSYLINAYPFFYDKAYLVDYNSSVSTDYYQLQKSMTINYGGTTAEQYYNNGNLFTVNHDLTYISTNSDQGSTYVCSLQKVSAESYSQDVTVQTTVSNNADSVYYAYPSFDAPSYPSPDSNITSVASVPSDAFEGDIAQLTNSSGAFYQVQNGAWVQLASMNEPRNNQSLMIAMNLLVRNYKPGDCVSFQCCEVNAESATITFPSAGYVYATYAELFAATGMADGDVACCSEDGVQAYFKYDGANAVWENDGITGDRNAFYKPYSACQTLTDTQNSITLTNAPLACTQLIWPSCETVFWWGDPDFMDSSQTVSSLQSVTQSASTDGTADTDLSNKYASKLTIGSQTTSELEDDRAGFTGIIIEKNWNNDLYRIAGYDNGTLESYMASDGKFYAGGGNVVLDSSGIAVSGNTGSTITIGGTTIASSGITMTSGTIGGNTFNSNGITLNRGSISIGSTVINSYGIYADAGTIGGNSFNSNGITINKGTIKLGSTTISSTAFTIDVSTSVSWNNALLFVDGATQVGGMFGTSNSIFLSYGKPSSPTYPFIVLTSSECLIDGPAFRLNDRSAGHIGHGIAGRINSYSDNSSMLLVQGNTATVPENSDASISFSSAYNGGVLPVVTVTPYGNAGSTNIGTDLHIVSVTSSGFTVRIPDNCTQIMWIAIGAC